ncbi:hypothetical protein [Endozoicomonas sp. ONNA2]|uniref:hypothetical protein n=1 Tax=Endozoicomonas sp. ONNA2 TaxID=2828741 RepID=UPI00214930C5|nr:hypothetical protein [Endozoicomonas sp. ONNA2]
MDSTSLSETAIFHSALECSKKLTQPVIYNNNVLSIGGIRHTSATGFDYRPVREIPIGKRSINDPGPILVKCNNNFFWDLSRIDLKSLLLPETFFTKRAKFVVGLQLGKSIAEVLFQGSTTEDADIRPLNVWQQYQYKFCKLKLFDYPAQFVFFDLIGSQLRRLLPEALVAELDSKQLQDYLSVKESFINPQLNEEQKASIQDQLKASVTEDVQTVCNAQQYRYSQPDGMNGEIFVKAFAPKIRGVLLKVLGELARGGIPLHDAPEFIGYVPPEIANPLAEKSGFLDSNWSGNFLHGKYSHLLALAFLSREAGLSASTLKAVVTHDLWDDLLDQSPYANIYLDQLGEHEFLIHDRNPFTFPCNPFAFQQMLCTGEVSSTLRQIADLFEGLSTCEQAMLSTAFQEQLTPERLLSMAQNTQLLEHIIALEHHNDILEIKQHFAVPTLGLVPREVLAEYDNWTPGQFVEFKHSSELLAFAAKRAFQRGDKVVAISNYFKNPLYQLIGSEETSQREIRKLQDFEVKPAFISFLVWPSQNAPYRV